MKPEPKAYPGAKIALAIALKVRRQERDKEHIDARLAGSSEYARHVIEPIGMAVRVRHSNWAHRQSLLVGRAISHPGRWRAWVARHGRRLWGEHGIDGAGDVAVIVDPRHTSATLVRQ